MKAILGVVLALVLASGLTLAAQEHHAAEKKSSDELDISTTVRIGDQTLEPGHYLVACDRRQIIFTRLPGSKVVAKLPCTGKNMSQPAAQTELYTQLDERGVRFVDKLLIRGSTIEHTF